jgi:uncharacterized membrane protein YvlD (DUF360 family)
MVRALLAGLIRLLANTIGLIVATLVLSGMSITGVTFVVAVLIFTLIEIVTEPLLRQTAERHVPALMGGVSLVATFIGLVLTTLISSGLKIHGISTWLLATLIVWVAALIAGLILPLFLVKKAVNERRGR